MRIGFDARMISHPGIGRYIKNLLNAMLPLNTEHEFLIFGNKGLLATCSLEPTSGSIVHWDAPIYSIKEQLSNPFNGHGLDIVHIPHFNVPLGINKGKLVVTIHDLIYTKFPEYLPLVKRKVAKFLINSAIKRSDTIISVSENTKKDILEISPIAEKKTEVIFEAADPAFKVLCDKGLLDSVRDRYSLPENMILFVGSLKRHKNIERLVDAYNKAKTRTSCNLVIIGRYHKQDSKILRKIRSSGIIYLGEVPAEDIVAIYNLADLLVFPSLYEGFGLPVLEAFASGVPVAASNASSLPEVVGSAGVLFDPYDTDDICDKICKIMSDKGLRHDLIEKGQERLKEFSWEKTAEQTLAVYEDCYSNA